ncbi:glyoxylate reductase Ecym_7099 [Eremothecium cymbalariae DBVPG|uniref:D-isomer specific 2-hydroxyacid dehydrogenase NAD-binding domain-containing protein n=1 Tax=Eremothecium cymbalariae (strain CBS 270.75 / DBVPG 7215 / KCTC 17166 / NRRL Y-17582) TaxID=931890 RepID=G8JVT6_ERECY|nr:hypothetical protein Ecym_7099 [Eremothecium cymbalariae DBVPG\
MFTESHGVCQKQGKPKVLILNSKVTEVATHIDEWEQLSEYFDFVLYELTTTAALQEYLPTSGISALWISAEFFNVVNGLNDILDYLPPSMKLLLIPWVGYEFSDPKMLREKYDITVCNIGPNSAANAAELAVHLSVSCFRLTSFWEHCFRFMAPSIRGAREFVGGTECEVVPPIAVSEGPLGDNEVELKGCSTSYMFPKRKQDQKRLNLSKECVIANKQMDSLFGKRVLILGFGSIGQAIGKRLSLGFEMEIFYHKRSGPVKDGTLPYSPTYLASLDHETCSEIDLIILALPGGPGTENMVNEEFLSKFKDGVRIVNVGRGSCIDEDAFFKGLDSGKIASAGLDVYKGENSNQIDKRFFQRWDVTLLPHIGTMFGSYYVTATRITLKNLESFFIKGEGGIYPLN